MKHFLKGSKPPAIDRPPHSKGPFFKFKRAQYKAHCPRLRGDDESTTSFQREQQLEKLIQYHTKTKVPAILLLEKLFSHAPATIREATSLTILVIGAGSFPSYRAVLAALMHECPDLQSIEFLLVEPIETLTQLFLKHFSKFKSSRFSISIKTDHRDIQSFLNQENPPQFDIVYFEHPEVMTLPIVLDRLGLKRYKNCSSLRESVPAIVNVIKPTGFIVASSMSTHERKQLQTLLHFSGYREPFLFSVARFKHFFYGGPFTSGLSLAASSRLAIENKKDLIVQAIRKSDHHLCYAVGLSLLCYIIFCTHASLGVRAISVFFMLAQLGLHRPGRQGSMVKLALLIGQIALV